MIPWLVLLLTITKRSKIVQGYATINHQSLESTKCGQTNAIVKYKKIRLSFSISHTVTPSSFGRLGSCKLRMSLASKESVTLCHNDTRKFEINRVWKGQITSSRNGY